MKKFTKRQKDIIYAALGIITRNGIQGMTIKNLAKAIKVTEGAIYKHFNSKAEVLAGILSLIEQINNEFYLELNNSTQSSLKNMEYTYLSQFKKFKDNPSLTVILFSEEIFKSDNNLSKKIINIMKEKQEYINSIIKNGIKNNEIRDDIPADQLSLIIMGSLRLIVTKWRLSDFSFDLTREGEKQWNSIMKLIRKKSSGK